MDYLTQYADFLKKRSPASEPIPEGVIGKLMLAQNAAPKLETDMALPGADIVFKSPSEAPPAQVQDMPVAEISAEAPREIESKYKMLNRILGIGDNMLEKAKMPEDQQRSVIESFQAVKQAANRPQRKLDLSDIQARMGSADGQKGGEWDTSDYIKAALVATLPALAGGLAGGLAGAAGGAPAGVKGIDLAIKQSEDKKKSKTDALSKEADMRIKQFNAESQDSGRQIKTMADLVKLEVDTYGKIQEPTKKLLEKFLPAYAAGEIDTYERELQEKGLLERKGLEEETQGQVEGEKIASKEREGAASRKFKAGENQSDRDFKAEQADLDRQLREKIAKQAAKAKGSAASTKVTAGGLRLSPDKILKVNEGLAVPAALKDVHTTIINNTDLFGPVWGRVAKGNPLYNRGQTIQSQIKSAAQAFGKFMEGGVLRKEDELKYEEMFPKLIDPPRLAENKLANVERLLSQKINSDIDSLGKAGYDISAFTKANVPIRPYILDQKPKQRDPRIQEYADKYNVHYDDAEWFINDRKRQKEEESWRSVPSP